MGIFQSNSILTDAPVEMPAIFVELFSDISQVAPTASLF